MSLKEDEKEVLAHIVQNIDEQEIFLEFVAKAETIKEAWQIAKIFENKKKEFAVNIHEYDALIQAKEERLKSLTAEIERANILLEDTNAELANIKSEIENMQGMAQIYKSKATHNEQSLSIESFDMRANFALTRDDDSNPLDFSSIIADFQPLSVVSVRVKNGATAMARVAQTIYPPELYDAYRKAAKRLFRLKDKISELELKNEKLHIELRDLTEEDNFKEQMRSKMNDMHDDYIPINTLNIPDEENIIDGETHSARLARIDKKKERVEEMLNQLSNALKEEGVGHSNANDFLQAFKRRNE